MVIILLKQHCTDSHLMMNIDTVVYNIAVFITALVLLEIGADKFIDHTAIVAHRTRVSQTLVALLTAGGEWEEVCRS